MNFSTPYRITTCWMCTLFLLSMVGCVEPVDTDATSSAVGNTNEATSPKQEPPAVANSDEQTSNESTSVAADTGDEGSSVDRSDQVLRHAVFFSFKEDSTEQDVQSVVDAFTALPSKIDAIIDYEWGTNNSPEGLDDGFTHCFLLTFENEKGREEYLPHPAHAGEFADVLRPHMKDVFVFDYWGTAGETSVDTPLRHAVFFKFKDDASREAIEKVEQAFAALPSKIDTIKDFEWGTNNSPENKDDGFTHCFLVTFASDEGRATYLPHPDHQAFVEILKPVLDKVRVLDYQAQ